MIQERVRALNTKEIQAGPIVYWMDRDMRIQDNWALVYAQTLAQQQKVPLLVVYNLVANFLGGSYRQWVFKIGGLQEIEVSCKEKNIPFFVLVDETGKQSVNQIVSFCEENSVGALVTDFSPLRVQREWKDSVAKKIKVPLYEVDAHNIVPAWTASSKQEFGAYTIRPKLYRLLPTYLDEFPKLKKHGFLYEEKVPMIHWDKLLKLGAIDRTTKEVTRIIPGEKAAHTLAKGFVSYRLKEYGDDRNDPLANAQSNISPYLHYGMIAPQRVALMVLEHVSKPISKIIDASKNKAKVDTSKSLTLMDHAGAFLEELIIRRELSDNFCLYNENYDSPLGFPDWAKKSHKAHTGDPRDYVYTRKQFEHGETHDELWNAAQFEMVTTGKMHGYMRMYWAKKILEWTASPEDAMRIAIYLNDKYELDGRDPNGYAGIAWSIGGVHDRAWFERPIFGQIRYMAQSGCEKKFDVKAYIQKYTQSSLF